MSDNYHEYRSPFGDTTLTKVFVGGLAWETPTDKMRAYFEQFGEILEAVIICDKSTGKSKGYGFVTFRDPAAAQRACVEANPYIDGRRANCNIAAFGRPRPSPPRSSGRNQGVVGAQGQTSSSSYSGMPTPQQTLPQPYFYHPYAGYPAYTAYGYQGIYNPAGAQVQQSQYYGQYYGGGSQPSSSLGGGPYYYGYSLPNHSRGAGYGSSTPPAQRINAPSYLYYPTQMETGHAFAPTFPNPAAFPSPHSLSPSSATTAARHQLPSSTPGGESQTQQSTSADNADTMVIRSEEPSTSS